MSDAVISVSATARWHVIGIEISFNDLLSGSI